MSTSEVLYSKEHVWLRISGDHITLGMTDFAQRALGDIVFVDLPEVGTRLSSGQVFCSLDSLEFFYQFLMPVSGEVTVINTRIEDEPELINEDPMKTGWLIEIFPFSARQMEELMTEEAYVRFLQEQPELADKERIRKPL